MLRDEDAERCNFKSIHTAAVLVYMYVAAVLHVVYVAFDVLCPIAVVMVWLHAIAHQPGTRCIAIWP